MRQGRRPGLGPARRPQPVSWDGWDGGRAGRAPYRSRSRSPNPPPHIDLSPTQKIVPTVPRRENPKRSSILAAGTVAGPSWPNRPKRPQPRLTPARCLRSQLVCGSSPRWRSASSRACWHSALASAGGSSCPTSASSHSAISSSTKPAEMASDSGSSRAAGGQGQPIVGSSSLESRTEATGGGPSPPQTGRPTALL